MGRYPRRISMKGSGRRGAFVWLLASLVGLVSCGASEAGRLHAGSEATGPAREAASSRGTASMFETQRET
jgi:hypothetical protein